MDEFSLTVVIQNDSSCALTAHSMTRMTSLTYILLAYFIRNIAFALSLYSHRQMETEYSGHLAVRLGFKNIHMLRSTLAHAQTNYHVSQFGH
jgi:hypothetical protein